jgi:hypothetical protein
MNRPHYTYIKQLILEAELLSRLASQPPSRLASQPPSRFIQGQQAQPFTEAQLRAVYDETAKWLRGLE